MNNYFYNMVDPDEMTTLEYIPTIPKFLEFIKKQYSDYPAISDKVTTYTYEELVSRVAKRVTFINSLGLEKGSNIAVLAKNDLDAMELFLAIPAAGHVLIMLPNALNDKALAGINLLEYLKDAGYQLEKIVVERNLEIIPRDQLENVVIQENDSIEVLSFVGGG